jgi:hypothetical protein
MQKVSREDSDRIFGRDQELRLLSDAVRANGPRVFYLHGAPGIGKSALIRAFIGLEKNRRRICLLDGHALEPTERGFLEQLSHALKIRSPSLAGILEALSRAARPVLVIVDAYELLSLLDAWLRQVFMARVAANLRLVLVSRFPPAAQWSEAPEWRGKVRAFQLQPLSESAALELLANIGIDPARARALARFAYGHPLALVIGGAAAATQVPSPAYGTPQAAISALAQRFLSKAGDPRLREALRAASVVRRITRSLLRALIPELRDDTLFDRLTGIPFIEPAPDGLMIHDAVREAVRADLEAIDPKAFQRYRRAAWQQLGHEAKSASLPNLWRYTADLIFLIENPAVREAFFPRDAARHHVERAGATDASAIREITAAHDGKQGLDIVERWWRHKPDAFYVVRDSERRVAGFYFMFDPRNTASSVLDSDPLTLAWMKHLRRNPLPKGQTALFLRRWLTREHGEAPAPAQAAAWLDIKRHYMERRPVLQRVYLTLTNFAPYAEAASGLGIRITDENAVAIGDAPFLTLELDMGPRSVDGWLARMAAAEMEAEQDGLLDERSRALVVHGQVKDLTRKEFDVMRYLTLRQGEAVTRIELLNDVWGLKYSGGNVVDTVIASLRKKLGKLAHVIETVHGHGYLYRSPALSEPRPV